MRYIVNSTLMSDLTKAVKEHGADCVWWLGDSTRVRDVLKAGLTADKILPVQQFSEESALVFLGEDATVWSQKVPAKKAPVKKPSVKKEE